MKMSPQPSPQPELEIVVLAAGKGTRMYSALPKVLHPLAGRALVEHVLTAAQALNPTAVHVVYGYGGESVPQALAHRSARFVLQAEQHGTGHAVQQAVPEIRPDAVVLVLYGDVPLIRPQTLEPLVAAASAGAVGLLTVQLDDPTGYGRILRDGQHRVVGIVEHKDATATQRAIREANTGILALPARALARWLARLRNDNVQAEYYLTDVIAMAAAEGVRIETASPAHAWEVMGVNSKTQLAELERIAQRNAAQALMERGVTLMDPARFDLRGTLNAGQDVVIDVNVVIEGDVVLGDRVRIGPNNVIRNCRIGDDVVIQANCVMEDGDIGAGSRIGPFARIRPGSVLAKDAHIGNFVEIKNSTIGAGSKVNHLSYVGDTTMGSGVNIGAGTITANYDGANKHKTVIEDNASTGSNSVLVAPVKIGAGATIGAGSVINRDAPPGELTVARAKQVTIPGWKRPVKKKD
jgi:bifunctional UDP-N-acetylglucosamine pyrophosphorylase/glucosamine-1-phosphate N-acetyltransferase